MIEALHLHKSYGSFHAVRDLSFRVGEGEVVGFLGPNGAGKSTTLRILAGFLGMTSGKVTIAGHDIIEEPDEARAKIGYMPESTPLYGEMRVGEYLRFRAELKGVPRKQRQANVERAMREARVDHFEEVLISKLSKGYRQRVGLADALVARPPILILDEPTAGLDPNQIREVRALVRELGKEHTILLSTHILSEVESVCSRAIVIAKGKVVAEGSLEELRARRRSDRARLVVAAKDEDGEKRVAKLLAEAPKVAKATPIEDRSATHVVGFDVAWDASAEDTSEALEEVVARLVAAKFGIREATPLKASLDEVFAQLTEGEPPTTEKAAKTAEKPSEEATP